MQFDCKFSAPYNKKTLQSVSFELRFSPILQIAKDSPAEFQNGIINAFPLMSEQMQRQHTLNLCLSSSENAPILPSNNVVSSEKLWIFQSGDNTKSIILTKKSLTIATDNYRNWVEFKQDIQRAFDSLVTSYKGVVFTRMGLRYINVFSKKRLGIQEKTSWKSFIEPSFLGLLSSKAWKSIENYQNTQDLKLELYNAKARVMTTTATAPDDNKCLSLMFDTDLYINETLEIKNIEEQMDFLHNQSRGIFEFAIKEKLRKILSEK